MASGARQHRATARRSPKLLAAQAAERKRESAKRQVAATMKRYARLDDCGQPMRCAGFRTGSKIIFDTPQLAESCRRSLVDRGLSQTRSVHECRRREGETHFHLTRRVPVDDRD